MDAYERIMNLCKWRGIAATKLESELGFGRGSIGKMKGGKRTSYERLKQIADYFGVSIEYLTSSVQEEGPIEFNGPIVHEKSPFDYFPEGYSGYSDDEGNVRIVYPDGKQLDTSIRELDRIVKESESFIKFKLETLRSEQ